MHLSIITVTKAIALYLTRVYYNPVLVKLVERSPDATCVASNDTISIDYNFDIEV
jgi:hypothetical protein